MQIRRTAPTSPSIWNDLSFILQDTARTRSTIEWILPIDAALTRPLRHSTVSTSTLLPSCLDFPEVRWPGLLELVRSRYSMLHNSEPQANKKRDLNTAIPFPSYFIVRLSTPTAISYCSTRHIPGTYLHPSKWSPSCPIICLSTSFPRDPCFQLRNLTFQPNLLSHEPRSRLFQIGDLLRRRGLSSSFDFLRAKKHCQQGNPRNYGKHE